MALDLLVAMRTYVEIVEKGSLTAAANAMNRSLPTVVRTLAALEEHLGVTLLRRTTRSMSLTAEGQDYLKRCKGIIADIEEAERSVKQEQGEVRGHLNMTAPVQFGLLHIAPAVIRFLKEYEEATVDLLLVDWNVDLVSEGIDLALRIGHLSDSSMIAVKVGEVRRVVVASPALIEAVGIPKHPTELSCRPCIRFQAHSTGTDWTFQEEGVRFSVKVSGPLGCNQVQGAKNACLEGVGFGSFLSYQTQSAVASGELVRVLQPFEPEPVPVQLVYPGGRLTSSRLRALIQWLRKSLSPLFREG